MKRITHGTSDFSDLISSCTSIKRCPAVPVDCIIIIVKRRDWDGKVWKSICWQTPPPPPAQVFLNRHLSYVGSVRLTVVTVT